MRGTGHADPTSSPPVGVCPGGRAKRSTGHLLQLLVVLCVGAYVAGFDTQSCRRHAIAACRISHLCALIAWNAFGLRIGIVVTLYAIGAMTSAMYLGEHYAVDVVAGAALAALAVALTAASPPPAHAAPGARLKKPVMTGFS